MSDAFWACVAIMIPSMFATYLAYRRAESASKMAHKNERTLDNIVRNGNGKPPTDVLSQEELTRLYRLLTEEVNRLELKLALSEKRDGAREVIEN